MDRNTDKTDREAGPPSRERAATSADQQPAVNRARDSATPTGRAGPVEQRPSPGHWRATVRAPFAAAAARGFGPVVVSARSALRAVAPALYRARRTHRHPLLIQSMLRVPRFIRINRRRRCIGTPPCAGSGLRPRLPLCAAAKARACAADRAPARGQNSTRRPCPQEPLIRLGRGATRPRAPPAPPPCASPPPPRRPTPWPPRAS